MDLSFELVTFTTVFAFLCLVSSRFYHTILNWFETVLGSYLIFPLIQLNLGYRQLHSNINFWGFFVFFFLSPPVFFKFGGGGEGGGRGNDVCLNVCGCLLWRLLFLPCFWFEVFLFVCLVGFFFKICCSEQVPAFGCGFLVGFFFARLLLKHTNNPVQKDLS